MRPDQSPGLRSAVEYLAREGAEALALEPLSEAAVAQVASDVMRAEPDESMLQMASEAGGNPFLLVELLEGLLEEKLVAVASGRAILTDYRLPARISTSMRERLARLPDSARELATVAGSLGRTFSVSDLAEMIGVRPASLVGSVEQLVEVGIMRELGDKLCFHHDLIREAVRHACAPSVRRALDRQAADVMLVRGALPVEVALQLAASAAPGDEVAITTLLTAAEALATTDPGASADLSGRALELAPERHPLARSARRANRDVAPRGRTDRGGEGFRGSSDAGRTSGSAGGRGASRHRRHVVGLSGRESARQPGGLEARAST